MKLPCYFLAGKLINIGEWDYRVVPPQIVPAVKELVPSVIDPKTGEVTRPAYEKLVKPESLIAEKILNPLPDGAVLEEREVIETAHGLFLADDYASLRRYEYPPITEQLDALWKIVKAGAIKVPEDAIGIADAVEAVKTKFPKP